MKRGDVVTIALQGDYGKPRPALVVQSDLFDAHPSVTVLPITSELRETPLFRVDVEPNDANGLRKKSQVTKWISAHCDDFEIVDKTIRQSSDDEYHCLSIVLFCRSRHP